MTHIDARGDARMVDVTAKPVTAREAVARGRIRIAAPALRLVREGQVKKGDALNVARLAGIMAAKQTAALIPLCHPLPLSGIDVTLEPRRDGYEIRATVRTTGTDRGRDGSADRGVGRRADAVRHGEGCRQDDDDLRHRARLEAWRRVGRLSRTDHPTVRGRPAALQTLRDRVFTTLADIPRHVAEQFSRPAFVRRCRADGFQDWSTDEFVEAIRNLSLGLDALGIHPGDRVAIMSESRPEWVIADLAILTAGGDHGAGLSDARGAAGGLHPRRRRRPRRRSSPTRRSWRRFRRFATARRRSRSSS